MKYLLLFSILILACQNQKIDNDSIVISAEETQIAKDLIQGAFDDLWGGVDSTKINLYHTEDFIILEHGEIWDNDRIKVFMRKQLAKENRPKRINKMDYISIEKHGEAINIAYYNDADFMQGDSIVSTFRWLESALAIPTENGWRLKMMHSTRAPRKEK